MVLEDFFDLSFFTRPPDIFLPVHNWFYPSKWTVNGSLHKAMVKSTSLCATAILVGWMKPQSLNGQPNAVVTRVTSVKSTTFSNTEAMNRMNRNSLKTVGKKDIKWTSLRIGNHSRYNTRQALGKRKTGRHKTDVEDPLLTKNCGINWKEMNKTANSRACWRTIISAVCSTQVSRVKRVK